MSYSSDVIGAEGGWVGLPDVQFLTRLFGILAICLEKKKLKQYWTCMFFGKKGKLVLRKDCSPSHQIERFIAEDLQVYTRAFNYIENWFPFDNSPCHLIAFGIGSTRKSSQWWSAWNMDDTVLEKWPSTRYFAMLSLVLISISRISIFFRKLLQFCWNSFNLLCQFLWGCDKCSHEEDFQCYGKCVDGWLELDVLNVCEKWTLYVSKVSYTCTKFNETIFKTRN